MKKYIPFIIIIVVVVLSFILPTTEVTTVTGVHLDTGDTAWLLASAALVLLMTPGLAFFYGGMVHKKNVISTMLQSFVCMGLVTIVWIVFGEDIGGIIGNPTTFYMMKGTLGNNSWPGMPTIPLVLFAMFQLKFAVLTPALITGGFAERIKFNAYLIFLTLFVILIYAPLAHSTWHPDGKKKKMGVSRIFLLFFGRRQ